MSVESVAAERETVAATVGDRAEGVATVELSRPAARNALDAQLRADLAAVLEAVPDSDVRVVVLTGDPEADAFVAGADISELRERTALEQREASKRPRVYERVDDLPVPVIARVNGHALGGGCELALACDVRIATSGRRSASRRSASGSCPAAARPSGSPASWGRARRCD